MNKVDWLLSFMPPFVFLVTAHRVQYELDLGFIILSWVAGVILVNVLGTTNPILKVGNKKEETK